MTTHLTLHRLTVILLVMGTMFLAACSGTRTATPDASKERPKFTGSIRKDTLILFYGGDSLRLDSNRVPADTAKPKFIGSIRKDTLILYYQNNPTGVLLNLAAHPDDEDGATLAYYAKLRGMRVYSLFYTRGEGGQNETGTALYDELGALRTAETYAASRIQGSKALFLGFTDFGFSKTAKETFSKWGGKDAVLEKLVYQIRRLKPDVVFTNHDTVTVGAGRQHGHHQAVGITAFEAFEKAADSTYHPDHFSKGVSAWQIKKLFYRKFRAASTDSVVTIDASKPDASGRVIEDIALEALAQHRTQGMDKINRASIPPAFRQRRYALTRSVPPNAYPKSGDDFFTGLSLEIKPVPPDDDAMTDASPAPLDIQVSPSDISSDAATVAESIRRVPPTFRRTFKLTLINRTKRIVPASLTVSVGTKAMLRKPYALNGLTGDTLVDVIEVPIEKDTSLTVPRVLSFELRAADGAAPSAQTAALVHPVTATVSRQARIGLISTYDDAVLQTLKSFGIRYDVIDSSALANGQLSGYTAIVLDLRAYFYRTDLAQHNRRLLEYAENGGNVICFYHKPGDWKESYAPYPLALTGERVTEEDAAVSVLAPKHFFFTTPNRITAADWNGWRQERSIYLPSADTAKTSARYERLLSMSDEGETQPPTSLLAAKVGKGTYTYVSLALYRQLKILNNGGLKLFFNLLSQPRAPKR